jgi:hypothetical protein
VQAFNAEKKLLCTKSNFACPSFKKKCSYSVCFDLRTMVKVNFEWHSRRTKRRWSRFQLNFFAFSLLIFIPPLIHTLLSSLRGVCGSPHQTPCYHTLGHKSGVHLWLLAFGCFRDRAGLAGFNVLTIASTKMAVFWVVAPCTLVEFYRRFRGPCCIHGQGDDFW